MGVVKVNLVKPFFTWLAATAVWAVVACVLAFYGWWLDAVAERDSHQAFFEWAVKEVDANNQGAAALVLIEDGVVVQRFFKGDVGEDTLFPTASFSK